MTITRMTDLRRCQVILLDERVLEFPLQPRLMTSDLLDIAASHFSLREKEYFGLSYENDAGHRNWLRSEKRVTDHDLPRKISPVIFTFTVRLYVSSITLLKETKTIELFYLHARNLIYKGELECDSETIFLLGAYVLQATHGDFVSESIARSDLRKLPVLPMRVLKEHPSLSYCEKRTVAHYKRMSGIIRGEAIVNYLSIVERLPMYGVHYYDVKDKGQIPWKLGLSHRGIGQYDFQDKKVPRKLHMWSHMENLYYREKKFSVEVRDPSRSSSVQNVNKFGTLRRNSKADVSVIGWYTSTQSLARGVWLMAVAQHQFHLDKKATQKSLRHRTLKEIAKDLSRSTSSLASSFASDFSGSLSDTASFYYSVDGDNGTACADMISALQARKVNLEERLQEKLEELKQLCLREAEITGTLPYDTPDFGSSSETPFRRTVGTSFEFSESILSSTTNSDVKEIEDLERDYEIQLQISNAAQRLAADPNQSKKVRKTRRASYQKSMIKLKTMEQQLAYMKRQAAFEKTMTESVNGSMDRMQSGTLSDDCLDSDSLGPFDSECSSHCSRESTPRLQRPSYLSIGEGMPGLDTSPASSSMSLDSSKLLDNRSQSSLPIFLRSPQRSLSIGPGVYRKSSLGPARIRTNFISTSEEMLDAIDHSKANGHAQPHFLVGDFGNSGIYSAMSTPRRNANQSFAASSLSASLNRLGTSSTLGRRGQYTSESQPRVFHTTPERHRSSVRNDKSSSLNDLLSSDYNWAETVAEETLV